MSAEIEILTSLLSVLASITIVMITLYFIYKIGFRSQSIKEDRYTAYELAVLDKVASKQGINISEELVKQNLVSTKKFRDRLADEMIKESFEKNGGRK